MQSAFLDVGLERTAFLHIAEIEGARTDTGTFKPIESLLHEGQRLMVQVAKDPIGTKGARLTTTISLAGRKLVYLPTILILEFRSVLRTRLCGKNSGL